MAISLLYATYYHFEHVHFHVNRFYANLGYKEAQHNLGHSYMHGKMIHSSKKARRRIATLGVGADHHADNAVYWLKQASDQGHAKAQYNFAISHLRGFNTGLQPGYGRLFTSFSFPLMMVFVLVKHGNLLNSLLKLVYQKRKRH